MSIKNTFYDVLIVGGGLAALTTAYSLAKKGYQIGILLSEPIYCGGNSAYAQGGIIYTDFLSDPEALTKDILYAGAYDQDEEIVEYFAKNAPSIVRKILIDELKVFSLEESRNNLTKEGGHSVKRILYKGDHTGKSIMQAFITLFDKYDTVECIGNAFVSDLLLDKEEDCIGVKALVDNKCVSFFAHNTVLATGGIGALYSRSTNPHPAFASAIAMAYGKNIALSHLEYIQFHPTALFHSKSEKPFLLSETMRGEGAILLDKYGNPFAKEYHPLANLAPRDVLTRAILMQMEKDQSDCVYLDATLIPYNLAERFPTIYTYCLDTIDLDIQKSPIPISPAMHYSCGGIVTDKTGRTSCNHLYAVGECAYTGIHGANRLASTSLLEALFWGDCIAESIKKRSFFSPDIDTNEEILYEESMNLHCEEILSTIQNTMWENFGILRRKADMKYALEKLQAIREQCLVLWNERKTKERATLLHSAISSCAIAEQCALNTYSKGCHYVIDAS